MVTRPTRVTGFTMVTMAKPANQLLRGNGKSIFFGVRAKAKTRVHMKNRMTEARRFGHPRLNRCSPVDSVVCALIR